MSMSTVINQSISHKVAKILSHSLADTYLLYLKTQNFHWNVVDPRFYALHIMLEKQYEELAEAIDVIAERIRTLNVRAPASMQQFLELTSLEENHNDLDANEMLRQLVEDHMAISNQIRPLIPECQKLGDEGSADLLIDRLRFHEKTAWMIRSHFLDESN